MSKSLQQAEHLVSQLVQAHRLSAGFYQRILHLFDQLAIECADTHFWEWKSSNPPSMGNKMLQPSRESAWRFLPLFESLHAYRRWDGDSVTKGNVIVVFRLCIDDAYKDSSEQNNSISGSFSDPLALPPSCSFVEIKLYRCITTSTEKIFGSIWGAMLQADGSDAWSQLPEVPEYELCSRTIPLANLIAEPEITQQWLLERLTQLD